MTAADCAKEFPWGEYMKEFNEQRMRGSPPIEPCPGWTATRLWHDWHMEIWKWKKDDEIA